MFGNMVLGKVFRLKRKEGTYVQIKLYNQRIQCWHCSSHIMWGMWQVWWRKQLHTGCWCVGVKEGDSLDNLGVDGRMIRKWNLNTTGGLNAYGCGSVQQACFCEKNDKTLGYIGCGDFLEQRSSGQGIKVDCCCVQLVGYRKEVTVDLEDLRFFTAVIIVLYTWVYRCVFVNTKVQWICWNSVACSSYGVTC